MLHTANHSEGVIGSGEEKYSGVIKELLRRGKIRQALRSCPAYAGR